MSVPVLRGRRLNQALRALKRIPISQNGREMIARMLVEAAASGESDVKRHSPRVARRMARARQRLLDYELARVRRIMDEWRAMN